MSFLAELDHELQLAGLPGGRRRRIIDEFDDHLRCDPTAVERLGDPAVLARRFADELGSALARRAAFSLFVALAPFGILFGVLFALLSAAGFTAADRNFVGPAVIFGTQLAFVGGTLALLRAWRTRRLTIVTAAQASVLARRTALGLFGGLLTVAGILVGAAHDPVHAATWFAPLAYATAAVGAITLGWATATLVQALRLRPQAPGPAIGDLGTDLGRLAPEKLRSSPWLLALAIAGLVAICIAVAGVAQADAYDGVARALVDATACIAGFALLGRPLGMRT